MASGGSRNRSGPPPDPQSARSEKRGIKVSALPATPYDGEVPKFGLPDPSERELELWAEAWTWPQAWAWSQPAEKWRLRSLRMWVRLSVAGEDREVNAAMLGQIHRFADQAAVTQAGLREAGWAVASDQLGEKRAEVKAEQPTPADDELTQRRKRAVGGGA